MTSNNHRKVLLIGWDAADWEHINPLLDAGELPTLESLINEGVMGNLATLQPVLSPMLWNSVATGKYAFKHGVHGFIEPDPVNGGARPCSSYSRKVKALWNIFTQQGLRSNVVGWWASHPAEPINGTVVTNAFNGVKFDAEKGWQFSKGTIHPADKAEFLAQFKVFPNELSHEHIFPFIPNADRIDQEKDARLDSFVKVLAETATIHAVATVVMETEPWDFMAVYYNAIDHFCHGFMQYHPPRMPNTSEEDFEIYKDVINGAYRFHDMMLERLLDLAGPETTVVLCSDHGFESGNLRPLAVPREPAGPATWHRDHGIVVMRGPGLKRDERIYSASLIDIAPTILAMYGLPIGEDMDGRPLVEAFQEPIEVRKIPSWDDVPGEAGLHTSETALDKEEADELMQQFAALGYIDNPGDDKEKQAREAAIEEKYNLARNYLWASDAESALPLFEEIVRMQPWESRFIAQLGDCYMQCGYARQAGRLLESAFDIARCGNPSILITWANAKLALGEKTAGLQGLRRAEQLKFRVPGVYVRLGEIYLRLRRWEDAERVFDKAVTLDPENAAGLQGLSSVYCHQGRNQETVDAALAAVSLVHRLPRAHFNLGIAMARSGHTERAITAFETVLRFEPRNHNAHRWLAAIYRSRRDDPVRFAEHRLKSMQLVQAAAKRRSSLVDRRETLFDLPEMPSEAERQEILLRERPDPQNPKARSGKTFVLVSGLPRSGTSLMMQMLEAGGMDVLTDGEKSADEDNPRGYFEWEPLKQIAKRPKILDDDELSGSAIKAVSALIRQMPPKHDYKVLFMVRPIDEVVASQSLMVERRGTQGAALDSVELARGLTAHRDDTLKWLQRAPHVDCLVVDYPALIAEPGTIIPQIVEFLGEDRLPRHHKMQAAVDPSLYRQRGEEELSPDPAPAESSPVT